MSKLKEYKFSDLYTMSSGISSKPEQAGHGFPFVSFSTVFNNYFLPETLPDLMDTSEQEQEKYSIQKGDILLTRTSETIDELGMSCVALKDYPTATYSGFVKRLRPIQKDITYDKYMGFYLRSKYFRKTMTNNAFITLRASLNEAIFSYINLYLPDFKTQKKIGDFLHLLNIKIELNQRINAELESMAKTLYDYWFVQFDFPNEKGKPYKSAGGKMVWNEELKREIPLGWEVGTLEDIVKIRNGFAFKSEDYQESGRLIIRTKNFDNNSIVLDDVVYISEEKAEEYSDFELSKFDFLLVMVGASVGKSVITPSYILPALQNQNMWNFLPKNEKQKIYTNFLMLRIVEEQAQSANGSARDFFRKDHFYGLKIAIPDGRIIEEFQKITMPMFEKIDVIISESQTLTELRDWLLPMLMNGQVKV